MTCNFLESKNGIASKVLLALLIFAVGCHGVAPKQGRKLSEAELVGIWAGFSGDGIYFSIELQDDGVGFFSYCNPRSGASLQRIKKWGYVHPRIELAISEIDRNSLKIEKLVGGVGADYIEATVHGSGWHRDVTLRREQERERRAELVTKRVSAYVLTNNVSSKVKSNP